MSGTIIAIGAGIAVLGSFGAPLSFDYKSQKLLEKFGSFEYSAYLCYNNKRKESYMETKDRLAGLNMR